MILAILQQTNLTVIAQQAQVLALQIEYLNAQDSSASYTQLTKLYAEYLAEALAANANLSSIVRSNILHLNSTSSLLPVSRPLLQCRKLILQGAYDPSCILRCI